MNTAEVLCITSKIAESTDDTEIRNVAEWLAESLENREHKPTLGLISFNTNHGKRFEFAEQFAGIEIPESMKNLAEGEPACFILDYNPTAGIMNEDNPEHIYILGLPAEFLKKKRIFLCDEVRSGEQWLYLSEELDSLCLVTNAAMAIHQQEREWLNNEAKHLFDPKELSVLISGMERLNNEFEKEGVRVSVADWLSRMNLRVDRFENAADAWAKMNWDLESPMLVKRHDSRTAMNGLSAILRRCNELLKTSFVDEESIRSAIKQLSAQKRTMVTCGKFASEIVLGNAITDLKIQAMQSIRNYSERMKAVVAEKIRNSSFEELDGLNVRITAYVEKAWDHYNSVLTERMNPEMEKICAKLSEQIDSDAGKLIESLDEPARDAITKALGLDGVTFSSFDRHTADFRTGSVSEITDRLRRETRNMVLLSIPLLIFVGPLAGIANIFIAKGLEKARMKSELDSMREEFVSKANRYLDDVTEEYSKLAEARFDEIVREETEKVMAAYSGLTEEIMKKLESCLQQQSEKAELKAFLEEQISTVLPELTAKIA